MMWCGVRFEQNSGKIFSHICIWEVGWWVSSWQNSQFLKNYHMFHLCLTDIGYFSLMSDFLNYWLDKLHENSNSQNKLFLTLYLLLHQFMVCGVNMFNDNMFSCLQSIKLRKPPTFSTCVLENSFLEN